MSGELENAFVVKAPLPVCSLAFLLSDLNWPELGMFLAGSALGDGFPKQALGAQPRIPRISRPIGQNHSDIFHSSDSGDANRVFGVRPAEHACARLQLPGLDKSSRF